jgi:hypothetical protein
MPYGLAMASSKRAFFRLITQGINSQLGAARVENTNLNFLIVKVLTQ